MTIQNDSAEIVMRKTERKFTYENTLMLTLNINRPVVYISKKPKEQKNINNRYQEQAMNFYRNARDTLYKQAVKEYKDSKKNDFPFRPFDAVMQYVTTYNNNCYLSTYYDRYEYTGGAHGNTIRASDTWNLKTGQRLKLYNFFDSNVNYRCLIIGQILMQADKAMQQNPGIYFNDYRMLIVKYFNSHSFYLTPEGISFYYQQYEIAPYSTGIVVFTIPYNILGWQPCC